MTKFYIEKRIKKEYEYLVLCAECAGGKVVNLTYSKDVIYEVANVPPATLNALRVGERYAIK